MGFRLEGGTLREPVKYFCFLVALFLTVGRAGTAVAGQLFPCVKAASSNNGKFLVLTDAQLKQGPGNTVTVQRFVLQVFPKEMFINAKDQLSAQGVYWTDWVQWSVILQGDQVLDGPGCALPMITDDGEFLILVHTGTSFKNDQALRIYRRRDHTGDPVRPGPDHGVFIRAITLKELWPPERLQQSWDDESPQWFAGGTFQFSSDCKQLIHKTRWGDTIHVNLQDGSIF